MRRNRLKTVVLRLTEEQARKRGRELEMNVELRKETRSVKGLTKTIRALKCEGAFELWIVRDERSGVYMLLQPVDYT